MRRVSFIVAFIALSACINESEVYQRNLTSPRITPFVRELPQSERQQIARVMAHRTSQIIVCICEAKRKEYAGKLYVYTAYPGAHERGGFGSFTLKKIGGSWQVIDGGTDLDPNMLCLSCNVH